MIAETLSQNPAAASTRNGAANGKVAAENGAAHPLRWNRDAYARLTELGFFEDRRVELIEGEIIEMAAMNSPHWAALILVSDALRAAFREGYSVSVQSPLDLGEGLQPQPDVAIIAGDARSHIAQIPQSAELVVEISDSTLLRDQTVKAGLYARAAIAEYWIVNLNENQLEVHRRPAPRAAAAFGHDYLERTFYRRDDTVSPLCAPQLSIRVADLLP